jgi:N6-adenosine-specific RNA methylase IME4
MILSALPPWPDDWTHLQPQWANLIEADPPWEFKHYSELGWGKSAEGKYETQSIDWIKALPVRELAGPNTLLLLWARTPMLDLCIETLKAWGFKYSSAFHWRKVSKNGKQLMGTGHRVRSMGEIILVGTLGKPKHKPFDGDLPGERRRHSQKPEEFYAHVEARCPDLGRRVSLFARASRAGWETTGNQKTLFDGDNAHDPVRRTRDASPCKRGSKTMLDVQRENPRGRGSTHDRPRYREEVVPLLLPLD